MADAFLHKYASVKAPPPPPQLEMRPGFGLKNLKTFLIRHPLALHFQVWIRT